MNYEFIIIKYFINSIHDIKLLFHGDKEGNYFLSFSRYAMALKKRKYYGSY